MLDTPGIRELQLWDGDLEQAFGDVDEIALRCRFADCAHRSEPGCAIREALLDGSLSAERWSSYGRCSGSWSPSRPGATICCGRSKCASTRSGPASSGARAADGARHTVRRASGRDARQDLRTAAPIQSCSSRRAPSPTRSTSSCPTPGESSTQSCSDRRCRVRGPARRSPGATARGGFVFPGRRSTGSSTCSVSTARSAPIRAIRRGRPARSATSRWSSGPSTARPAGSRAPADAGPVEGSSSARAGSWPASRCSSTEHPSSLSKRRPSLLSTMVPNTPNTRR